MLPKGIFTKSILLVLFLGMITWSCSKGSSPVAPNLPLSLQVTAQGDGSALLGSAQNEILYRLDSTGVSVVKGTVGPFSTGGSTGSQSFLLDLSGRTSPLLSLQLIDAQSRQPLAIGAAVIDTSSTAPASIHLELGSLLRNCYTVDGTGFGGGFSFGLTDAFFTAGVTYGSGYDLSVTAAGYYSLQDASASTPAARIAYLGNGDFVDFDRVPPASSFTTASGPLSLGDIYCVQLNTLPGGHAWLQVSNPGTFPSQGPSFRFRVNDSLPYYAFYRTAADTGGLCGGSTTTPTPSPTATPSLTATASSSPTSTATATWTASLTPLSTSTPSSTSTNSMTNTPSLTATATLSPTSSATASATNSPTGTSTSTATSTGTSTPTATGTATPLNTSTFTNTATTTGTHSATSTATSTGTNTPTLTPTDSATATPSSSPTFTRTVTPTDTATASPSPTRTATPSSTATATSTATSTSTNTPTLTSTATSTATDSMTATPSLTATASPTPTSTLTSSNTPTPTFTPTNTATSTATATLSSTSTFTSTGTSTATSTSTNTGTNTTTSTPTTTSTNTSTLTPTSTSTFSPTATPTLTPTNTVTFTPINTGTPTPSPTGTNTSTPTPLFSLASSGNAFGKRGDASGVVFNSPSEMLLIGGWDGTAAGISNSVYSSQDGKTWSFLGTGNFTARYGHTSLNFLLNGDTFTDRAWVLAGNSASGFSALLNDVWTSIDGKSWSRADTGGAFPARFFHSSVVFDPDAKGNRMWVIGGINNKPQGLSDVWSSTTGSTWTQATASGFPGRGGAAAVTFTDPGSGAPAIFLIAGFDPSAGKLYNDVWDSTDGATWKQLLTSLAPTFSARYNATAQIVPGKSGPEIWVVGGTDGTQAFNDAWFSKDGLNWNQVTNFAVNPERYGTVPYYFSARQWLVGGFEKNTPPFYTPSNPDDDSQFFVYP